MASETRCTITVDQEHDPPRWIRADGLSIFDRWNHPPANTGLMICIVVGITAVLLIVIQPELLSAPPWWKPHLAGLIFGSVIVITMTVWLRFLRRQDVRAMRLAEHGEDAVHYRAVRTLFISSDRMRYRLPWRLDSASFRETYQAQGQNPPLVILYGMSLTSISLENTGLPRRITGDTAMAIRSKRMKTIVKVTWLAIFLFTSFALASPLFIAYETENIIQSLTVYGPLFFVSAFFTYLFWFEVARKHVLIDRGRIEFSKRFKRRSLASDEATCVVYSTFGLASLQWCKPGHRWPVHTLYFHDPNDPRLATILNLWTADPLHESAP